MRMYTFMEVELEIGGWNSIMPIYEYRCHSCYAITDEYEKITSTNKTIKCSSCGLDAERIISSTQAYQSYKGEMRQEEKIERSTVVTKKLNTKTKEQKVFTKPLKIEKD